MIRDYQDVKRLGFKGTSTKIANLLIIVESMKYKEEIVSIAQRIY
ncbi:MAG TPA: hypothetical protein VIK26_08735 [Clostridium sp.]